MGDPLHRDRARALSFGGVADAYEQGRPSYPAELVDDVMEFGPRDVLDVGTGTGKAAVLFLARGCSVLGVEADSRMAAVAAQHGYPVEVDTFEAWEPQGRCFDLITSGQAWHWIDPQTGPAKAAAVLRPAGHLAAFWNLGSHEESVRTALEPVYRKLAPSIADSSTALGTWDERDAERAQAIAEHFGTVELRSYAWSTSYSRDRWLRYLSSHSSHVLLPDDQRVALFDAVGAVIDRYGGTIPYQFQTLLILATRPAG